MAYAPALDLTTLFEVILPQMDFETSFFSCTWTEPHIQRNKLVRAD